MLCGRLTLRGLYEGLGILYANQLPEKLEPNQLPPPELNNVAVLRQLHSEAMRQNRSVLHANLPWTRFQLHGGDKPAAVWFLVDENTTAHVGETMMLTDEEIEQVYNNCKYEFGDTAGMFACEFARAILAANTAKLLAGVEMPEPAHAETVLPHTRDAHTVFWYSKDQLQQYAAACAAQAREKALNEAKRVCLNIAIAPSNVILGVAITCAEKIDKLKGGE